MRNLFFVQKRVPFSFDEAPQEHHKDEKVVSNHAAPGGNKVEPENLGADKSSENPYAPHSGDVIKKRLFCFSNTLHKSFDDN